jgi:hypothetical protein
MRLVNSKMFDAKTRYREWTDGFAIHCGETLSENVRDAYMLFGPRSDAWEDCEFRNWNGSIDVFHQDPMGAHGWQSFEELFGALNRAINYVMIYYGRYEAAMDGIARGHSFDILTSNYYEAHTLLQNGPRLSSALKRGGRLTTRVGNELVKLNLRFPGDGLFEETWATSILDARIDGPGGFYRPREDEHYWLMAQNAVAQRAPIDRQILNESKSVAAARYILTSSDLPTDDVGLQALMRSHLISRGIWQAGDETRLRAATRLVTSALQQRFHILTAQLRTTYFNARDTILEKMPVLSAIKRSIKLLTSGRQSV